jgi:hypothetical protein
MTRVQQIESEVEKLSPKELAAFRKWFDEFDAAAWDRQIEDDVQAGKLDALAERALRSHASGKSNRL